MGTAVVLVIFSLFLATKLKTELMPADDQGTIAVTIETQPGLKIEEVDKILQRAENYVTQDPDLDSYMLSYGSSGLSMNMGGSGATLTAYLKDDRGRKTDQVLKEWKRDMQKWRIVRSVWKARALWVVGCPWEMRRISNIFLSAHSTMT